MIKVPCRIESSQLDSRPQPRFRFFVAFSPAIRLTSSLSQTKLSLIWVLRRRTGSSSFLVNSCFFASVTGGSGWCRPPQSESREGCIASVRESRWFVDLFPSLNRASFPFFEKDIFVVTSFEAFF